MTTDALLGTQVMGKRCKQLTTTLLASQIAVIEEKEVTQEKLTADQIVEKFIAAKKSYELKKDKESEQNLLDERLEQNSPFEKEFTKKQKKELFDIHISSDFADIASPATPRQIVDRKEIFGTSDDSIDKIVNSTDAGRLYQRVAKNNPAAITRITAAHRYVKPNAVYEEVVRHDVIAYAMTMYKYFLQEIYLQIWKETGYEETPSQPTDRSNPYVLIQETQTNLEKDASLYTSYITDLQDYCNKENITQSQINEATNGIQSFVNALNKTFQGKLPKEYMDKKYGTHLDTAKLFEHLRLYQAYQSKLGEYIKEHTEEIKKANDTIAEFTTRIQTEKSATPTPEEVTDEQCRVDEYLKAVGTQDTFWKEENKIRKAKGSVVIDDMEKYAVAEKVQEVTQQIGSENLKKRSRITGKLTKQRTDWLKKNQFTRNGRSAETALTSYARYITRLSNHPDFTRASKNYEALTKVFDAQTKDLSSSSQILFPATRQDMQNQKLKQAEVDQFYASLKNHTPALYGIANL